MAAKCFFCGAEEHANPREPPVDLRSVEVRHNRKWLAKIYAACWLCRDSKRGKWRYPKVRPVTQEQ